jgi:RNA-directed DNA polymerase
MAAYQKPSVDELRYRAASFFDLQGTQDLARRWNLDPVHLAVMAEDPKYRSYRIPKKKAGTFREIEDPEPKLKRVLRKLNADLQAVYYFRRSPAAYGFLANPEGDLDPRNIHTNAHRHIGCKWLMNVDMRDFFHLIDHEDVYHIFCNEPFTFPKRTSRMLASLCTYKGRLPMGAPTSPILSNYYSLPLDEELTHFAEQRDWVYTRYADDMTFSSRLTPIFFEDLAAVSREVVSHDLVLNPAKSIIYGPDEPHKEVTGLVVGEYDVSLSPEYLGKVREGIRRLDDVVNAKYLMPSGRLTKTPWVEEIAQSVKGMVGFADRVLKH